MKGLHFGAGNIGRGFVGKILLEAGINLIFVDANKNLVNKLNHYKKYVVQEFNMKKMNARKYVLKNIKAMHIDDINLIESINHTELITTSVGANNLKFIAIIIAKAILKKVKKKNKKILNIIACENIIRASTKLKNNLLDLLGKKYFEFVNKYLCFIDCTIDKIIPYFFQRKNNQLLIKTESFGEWIIDKKQFKESFPRIKGIKTSNLLDIFLERKLLILNSGHAVLAYFGLLLGYDNVKEAIKNLVIQRLVFSVMKENSNILIKKFGFSKNKQDQYIKDVLFRFKNPFLNDNLKRIARNPIQKLGLNNRLLMPILEAKKYGLPYSNLVKTVSIVLHYENSKDEESIIMTEFVKKFGIKLFFEKVIGVNLEYELMNSIIDKYKIYKNYINQKNNIKE
ncbi:mannitol-1-phosphate 5-dehydrogenase [Buchnera aphidicola (Mindarus keteleerifoliae)]|uniref:mannitol-1-phosphate 5-dehydrogenase n=1 Tax=Buchnera aphidicola TaxID=9 RepID=UPI0031B7313A